MHKTETKKGDFQLEEDEDTEVLTHAKMLRYMNFARHVKPKITPEAKRLLTQVYQKMRTSEFALQKNSYRITVRSLESLIRLSEACARVHCSTDVTRDHVEEAVKLLNSSIIKIDSSDYIMEIDETPEDQLLGTKQE